MAPKISVILPVYNAQNYVCEAIKSILSQSLTDFELLIINDGSTDNSIEIINQFTDSRITIIENEKNLGLISTLNKGITLAKGEFIARMDADDISFPQRFQKQIDYFNNNPTIDIVGSSYEIFGHENGTINLTTNPEQLEIELLFHNSICHPSVMMRTKSIIDNNLQFNHNFIHNEDWAFWLSALEKGLRIGNISDTLLKYRSEGQNITVKNKDSVKERFINLYTYYLKSFYEADNKNKFDLHWSIAHSQPQNYSINELSNQFKLIELSLNKNGSSKKLVKNVLQKKKVKLFYTITDKSALKGFLFLAKMKFFKWNHLYYLLTKIVK